MVPTLRGASASSFSSYSAIATAALQKDKGTLTSLYSTMSDPIGIISNSHHPNNTAKKLKLNSSDVSNRTHFLNLVKNLCKLGDIKLDGALVLFYKMVLMEPLTRIGLFNDLLGALVRD